jgi:glutathione S-transferase
LRAWLLLAHHGIRFREVKLPIDTETFHREIGRWSPARRVPVLQVDDFAIWDSIAICEYVNEHWLDGRGWPADPRARARARSVSAEMHSGFAALRNALPMNCRVRYPGYPLTEAVRADVARIEACWADCRARFGAGGPFLFGEFTIADAMFAPVALRFRSYDVALGGESRAYQRAVLDLPALGRWVDDALRETERIEADEVAPPVAGGSPVTPG